MSLTPPDKDSLGDWNRNVYADQWAPDTRLDFANVRWDSEYRDIVQFDDRQHLDQYIDGATIGHMRLEKLTHVRPYEPVRVNIPFNVATTANYIRVNNPALPTRYVQDDTETIYPEIHRNYYYFILDARYIAPNTTELLLQLDIWQTYGHNISPGWSYVERGHVGIANTSMFTENGRKYLTVPEGLDQGNEYNIIHTEREKIAGTDTCGVIVWSTVTQFANPDDPGYGDKDHPYLYTATGSTFEGVPNGASAYYFKTLESFTTWISGLSTKPWASQGIIAVQAVPDLYRYNLTITSESDMIWLSSGKTQPISKTVASNWRNTARSRIPEQYRHLDKFFTYPYTAIELTTNTGSPLILKPEQLQGDDIEISEIPYFAQPSPRIVIHPKNYNKHGAANTPAGQHDGGEHLDFATGIYDFPTFSVVNNGYMSFIASNKHSIQYQHQTADWSQSKALRSADTGYDQATMGIDASNQQTTNQIHTGAQMAAMQNNHGTGRAVTNAGTSLGMGAMGGSLGIVGGVTSAVSAGANEALNQSERNASQAISAGSMQRASSIQQNYQSGVRDSNRSLAQFAAKGDYAHQVAGINARVQDAKLTQPTTSGQTGGEAFNLSVDQWGYDVKVKMIPSGAMRIIGDFWLRYGYAVNTRIAPNTLQVMSHFTYWKFQEFTLLNTTIPEHYRNSIRGIFEKGVTVWSRPEDINLINPTENTPVTGNYYV